MRAVNRTVAGRIWAAVAGLATLGAMASPPALLAADSGGEKPGVLLQRIHVTLKEQTSLAKAVRDAYGPSVASNPQEFREAFIRSGTFVQDVAIPCDSGLLRIDVLDFRPGPVNRPDMSLSANNPRLRVFSNGVLDNNDSLCVVQEFPNDIGRRIQQAGTIRLHVEPYFSWGMGFPATISLLGATMTLEVRIIPDEGSAVPPTMDTPQPRREFFVTRLVADQDEYAVGEPVEIRVELERWAEMQQPDGSVISQFVENTGPCSFDVRFSFPVDDQGHCAHPLEIRVPADKPHCLRPFAPILPGEYTIEAWPVVDKTPESDYYEANRAVQGTDEALRRTITIRCIELNANLKASLRSRMETILTRYRQEIPSHRDAVQRAFDATMKPLVFVRPSEAGEGKFLPDMEFGSYNNVLFGDNDFTCHAYAGQVLKFLNAQHFRGEDRQLFAGVHYGPILRGFRLPRGPRLCGEHYGVVLYPAGRAYDDDNNHVLDPWPRQQPDVFAMKDFRWFYGWWFAIGAAVGVSPDPSRAGLFGGEEPVGFATHGSPVYWNSAWSGQLGPPASIAAGTPPLKPVREGPPMHFLLQCPATLEITDAEGRYVGLRNGKLACTIPDCQFFGRQKAEGDYSWCIALPPAEYEVRVTGTGPGTFHLSVADGAGSARTYTAAAERDKTAALRLTPGQPDAPLTLADGTQVRPQTSRTHNPPVSTTTPAGGAAGTKFDIRAARDKAQQLWAPKEGAEEEPEGWSKSDVDPEQLVRLFPPLRLRKGYRLRAYLFHEGGNGNGVVWAMPEDAPFPEPNECPTLENHLFKAPKPWDAVDDVMTAIEGDGSEQSYLAASLLRRELHEFGARWHGCKWTFHSVLQADPWKGGTAAESEPALDRPVTPERQWQWTAPKPRDWAPRVEVASDRVTVTFYTYCGLEKETIHCHTDTYRPGSYRARTEQRPIGTGGPGFLP